MNIPVLPRSTSDEFFGSLCTVHVDPKITMSFSAGVLFVKNSIGDTPPRLDFVLLRGSMYEAYSAASRLKESGMFDAKPFSAPYS